MHRGSEEACRIGALRAGEAAAFIAAVIAVFGARVPARSELVGEAGGELDFAFALPFAVEALALCGCREVGCPYQPVVEEILLQDELVLELALVGAPARLDVQREPDEILVGAEDA